jgi:hypothetical protein
MPVNQQQMRAIAFLAAAARPNGAKAWDEDGIVANIAKVADRSLGAVVIAVMQAAKDRNAQTPGVIASAGPHWRNPETAPTAAKVAYDANGFCSTCGQTAATCRVRFSDDHPFVSVAEGRSKKRPAAAIRQIVESVKAEVAHTPVEAPRKTLDEHARNPKVQVLRDALHPELEESA